MADAAAGPTGDLGADPAGEPGDELGAGPGARPDTDQGAGPGVDPAGEAAVAAHYGTGGLLERVLDAARATGPDPERLDVAAVAPAVEFHTGGHAATRALFEPLGLTPGMRLLDVGSGLGGVALHLAATYGCDVTGVDLTPEYVEIATALAARCGLADLARFTTGSATALPVGDAAFDGAYLLHVGMNVADKAALAAEAARALRPGGFLAVYDVMRTGPGDLTYPLPWAGDPALSHVEPPERYLAALDAAGFDAGPTVDRSRLALDGIARAREQAAAGRTPPLGQHLVMPDRATKLANVAAAIGAGTLAPVEVVGRLR